MGGSSTRKSTTSTQLPANQQLNIDTLLQGALDYFNTGGRSFFPGDTVADFDPLQTQGQNQLLDFAGGIGGDLTSEAIAGNRFFLDPENIFNPSNIPGFQQATDELTRGFTQNLTENILPNIRSGGTASGQFGGSATGIGEALSVERSNKGLSDSLGQLNLGAYQAGLNQFNQAQNRTPGLFALGARPGQITAGVGAARQGQEQREIEGQIQRHNFEQNEPLFNLAALQSSTGTAGQFGGSQTTTERVSSNPINQGIGALISGASLLGGNPGPLLSGGGKGGGGGEGLASGEIGPPLSRAGGGGKFS